MSLPSAPAAAEPIVAVAPVAPPQSAAVVVAAKPRLTLAFLRESWPFLKKLWGFIRPYRTRFLLGQLCGVIYAALNGAIPLLMKTVLGLALP
ncbi:MAG: hypothetical protein JO117_05195, partial [Verrucomicrobia bacterium]|nr:hypothetical protein [Verrucomicrobiota bacterium]